MSRMSRTVAARVMVVLASIALWAGAFGAWVARQALNTDQWVKTSSSLLADPKIQQALASYLGDQVVAPATSALQQRAPERLEALAPRAGAAIGDLAERAALRALRSGRFQSLWTEANRRAHERLDQLIDDESINEVAIDIRPMLLQVAERIGVDTADLQPDAGKFVIVSEDQVTTIRTVAKLLRGGAIVALVLALFLYVAAVWSAPPGGRRRTALLCGIGIAVAGLGLLVSRRVAGNQVVEAVAAGTAQAAADSAWRIATELLVDIASVVIVFGAVIVVVCWLAGPSRPVVWMRSRVSPVLRDQPGIAYGVIVGIVFIALAAGWLPGADSPLGVLVYVLLGVGGVFALQRLTPAG
jgi:hypothetical protein